MVIFVNSGSDYKPASYLVILSKVFTYFIMISSHFKEIE